MLQTSVGFLRLEVHSDDEDYEKWIEEKKGSNLFDFACYKLNQLLDSREYRNDVARVINIEHYADNYEVRPCQCDSRTWYKRHYLTLYVWYEKRKRGDVLL